LLALKEKREGVKKEPGGGEKKKGRTDGGFYRRPPKGMGERGAKVKWMLLGVAKKGGLVGCEAVGNGGKKVSEKARRSPRGELKGTTA